MKRRKLPSLLGCLLLTCAGPALAAPTCASADCASETVFIGRRTPPSATSEQGIVAARFDPRTGAFGPSFIAAPVAQPTWLAVDPDRPVLYSVSELGNDGRSHGRVHSLAIDVATGKLTPISDVDSGGGGATDLAYAPALATLFVANFGGGQVSAIPVGAGGQLSPPSSVQTDIGSGPGPRQKGPHAHSVTVAPGGDAVLVPDLGADRVFVYRYDRAARTLQPAATPFAALPPGSGPRHLVFAPDGKRVFLVTELSAEVFTFDWNASALTLTETGHVALDPTGFAGKKSGSEIALSRDGRFLYVGNRGENQIEVFAVGPAHAPLRLVQRIGCGGSIPWSFSLDPDGRWLLVANNASNAIAAFRIDPATGLLAATANRLAVPGPVAIAFLNK